MVSGQSQAWLLRLQPFSRALVTQRTARAALLKTAPPKSLLRFWSGTNQVLLVKRQFSAQPRGKAKHSSSSALPGGWTCSQSGAGASGHRDIITQQQRLSKPHFLCEGFCLRGEPGRGFLSDFFHLLFVGAKTAAGQACLGQSSSRDLLDQRVLLWGRAPDIWNDTSLGSTGRTHKMKNKSCRQR